MPQFLTSIDSELIVAIISLITFLAGAKLRQKGNYLLAHGRKTEAVIFTNNYKSDSNGGMYYPVVRFTTEKNEWITQELSIGFNPAKPQGTKLQVIYDPDDPKEVAINSTLYLEIIPLLLISIGCIGFFVSIADYLELIDII